MRWLQWSTIDLEGGLGGVEVHARSLDRELKALGISTAFSSDPKEFCSDEWDVIQTHGSAYPTLLKHGNRAIYVHTLHGTTLGRMVACGELLWPGGYAAAGRELAGVVRADVVLSVHPGLSLYLLARRLGKVSEVCWNGWDAAPLDEAQVSRARQSVLSRLQERTDFWTFLGRGGDRVKAADRVLGALPLLSGVTLVAAPGDGFEGETSVLRLGKLDLAEVKELIRMSRGVVLPSRYEGYSLVALETLSEGIPLVATEVGGVPILPLGVQGLVLMKTQDSRGLAEAVQRAASLKMDQAAVQSRTQNNRALLPTWHRVAEKAVEAVKRALLLQKER